jgi:hypothetical protein
MKMITKVENFKSTEGWSLFAIPPFFESPMENHRGGEIAIDEEKKAFYVYEVFLVSYGLESIEKAINSYHASKSNQNKKTKK